MGHSMNATLTGNGLFNLLRSVAAAAGLLALSAAGTQAAVVTVYNGDLVGWSAAAGTPLLTEDFADAALIPQISLTFGSAVGNLADGVWHERAEASQTTHPTITFNGLGAKAFGADFDLRPEGPGTGVALFVTFADLTTQLISPEIDRLTAGAFYGLISDTPILSIRFDAGTQEIGYEHFDLDNARLVSAVPIPAALPLLLSALAALGLIARRRTRPAV